MLVIKDSLIFQRKMHLQFMAENQRWDTLERKQNDRMNSHWVWIPREKLLVSPN